MSNIWAQGFSDRLDNNNSKPKCRSGNKPCGKRCIPDDQECRSEGKALKRALGVGAAVAGIGALGMAYTKALPSIKKGQERKQKLEAIKDFRRVRREAQEAGRRFSMRGLKEGMEAIAAQRRRTPTRANTKRMTDRQRRNYRAYQIGQVVTKKTGI